MGLGFFVKVVMVRLVFLKECFLLLLITYQVKFIFLRSIKVAHQFSSISHPKPDS